MAYANDIRTSQAGLLNGNRGFFQRLNEARVRYTTYLRTRDELSALTDRELADLGIYRADISRIAKEAAAN
jgi:uncharacterized protein YjiS (DUF1127 family)